LRHTSKFIDVTFDPNSQH